MKKARLVQRHTNFDPKSLAERYVEGTKRCSTWANFLRGIANTNTSDSIKLMPKVYSELLESFPTAESARETCDIVAEDLYTIGKSKKKEGNERQRMKAGETMKDFGREHLKEYFPPTGYDVANIAQGVCAGAYNWGELSKAFKTCDRKKAQSILLKEPAKTKKGVTVSEFPTGHATKGVDMDLLDVGCPQIVADLHMVRMIHPDMHGDEIHAVQAFPSKYNAILKELEAKAHADGYAREDYGKWHVENWLRQASKNPSVRKRYKNEPGGAEGALTRYSEKAGSLCPVIK